MDSSAKQNELPTVQGNHELDVCERFTNLAISERRKFAHSNPLSCGYLKWGHVSKECRERKTCKTCNRRHPTSLHDDALTYQDRAPNPESSEATRRNPIPHCIEACTTNTSVAFPHCANIDSPRD